MISALWKNPIAFFVFWFPKVGIALLIAAFVFLSKRKWWTVVVLLVIGIWIAANLIYFRANELFIGIEAIQMAGNLDGFEGSIFAYWNWKTSLFFLLTIVYTILIIPIPTTQRQPLIFISIVLSLFLLNFSVRYGEYTLHKRLGWIRGANTTQALKGHLFPYIYLRDNMQKIMYWAGEANSYSPAEYIRTHSIISVIPYIPLHHTIEPLVINEVEQQRTNERMEAGKIENDRITSFINDTNSETQPTTNLLFILVESLESWVLNTTDENGTPIAPNLQHLINKTTTSHGLYCDKVKSQVREGVSGDGQMICNTGLLPLKHGAACMIFDENTYPNWAHLFTSSAVVTPSLVWNQDKATKNYGYHTQIYPTETTWNDQNIIDTLIASLDTITTSPFCWQAITISMHTPFLGYTSKELEFYTDIPQDLRRYLHCVHYTDSCLGNLFDYLTQNDYWTNTTLVITGDHTIFKDMLLQEFQPYAEAHDLAIKNGKNYVPLIVYSPSIKEHTEVTDLCYQMDIYPTIMYLIGCENYYWKGFGVNLLDTVARNNRTCIEEEAYSLSEKLIRNNWFATKGKEYHLN